MNYNLLIALFLMFFLSGIITENSFSQEDDEHERKDSTGAIHEDIETEEVVITGTRIPEKIIDVPFSVFRVDKKELAYSRNISIKDVMADVPGLFLQSRYGSHDVRISIRGYGNRSNVGIRGIKILHDGITESEPDGETNIDAIDYTSLETVEVAKGNLSSLYTNAPGGVINFLTDMTFKQSFFRQTNMFGSYDLFQNGFKTGLMTNNYKFFTSYSYRSLKGFRDHANDYTHLVNSVFQIFPDNKSGIAILGNYAKGIIKLPGALTKEEYENDPWKAYDVAISSDYKRDFAKGKLGVRFNRMFGKNDQNNIELTGFIQEKDLQYTTNLLYNYNNRYFIGGIGRFTNTSKVFSKKNSFSVGIDYNYVKADLSSYNNVAGKKGDKLQTQNIELINNQGVYMQNQFFFYKDKASIFLSGRYDNVEITNDNQLFSFQNSTRKFSRFTPRVAMNYKIIPRIALYGSYGYAFDTPAAIELQNYAYTSNRGATTLNPDINPQKSKNIEFGIKGNIFTESDYLEKSFFEITYYNTRIEDEIVPFVINDQTFFRNAADVNRTGVECGLKFVMFNGFELVTNYTYSDFNYKDYVAINYTAGGDTISSDYSGNVVPASPKSIFNFIFNYQFKIDDIYTGMILWDMDYISTQYADDANTEKIPDYFFGNALVGVTCRFKNGMDLIFTTGVKNIFNRKYVGFVNINANPELPADDRRYYEPGEPRSYYLGLNLGYRF